MEQIEFGPLTDELRAELEGDERDPWDAARAPAIEWRPKEQHVGLRDDHGRLVANAGLLVVDVEVAGARFPIVGLGGVIVKRDYRGQGLSLRVLEAALAKAAALGPEFIVLFCFDDRMELYRKVGFEVVLDEVFVRSGARQVAMPMRTMWRALRPGATWPEGPVALQSQAF
jgi:predicted GNAT family N-acyltransferase